MSKNSVARGLPVCFGVVGWVCAGPAPVSLQVMDLTALRAELDRDQKVLKGPLS